MAPPRPSYLLTDIPDDLRAALSIVAAESNMSIQGIVLRSLYDHFSLDLPPKEDRRYVAWTDHGADRMVIRATPELFNAIKEEAGDSMTMRQVILNVLTDGYLVGLGS